MIDMETFKRKKSVLVKCFLISFVIWLVLLLICYFNHDGLINFCANLHHITYEQATMMFMHLLNLITVITFFFFLVPAIAMGWERACFAKQAKREVENESGL